MIRLMIDDRYPSMPWEEIDTVVFDVGNVLLAFQPETLVREIVPDRPDLHGELLQRVFRSPYWCMRDRGSATVEEVVAAMCTGRDELIPYVQRIMDRWIDIPPIAEGVRTLECCKRHGKRLIALTNYADAEFRHACERNGFFSLFDDLVVSSRLRMVKPARPIYDHLISLYGGLDPARTLFIDDSPANIEAALEFGWQGLCFNQPGKLDAFFGQD